MHNQNLRVIVVGQDKENRVLKWNQYGLQKHLWAKKYSEVKCVLKHSSLL